jgi:AhpD family alkylhydroperoxidase
LASIAANCGSGLRPSDIQEAIAEHGSFDESTQEAIALAIGATDNCDYCQAAHTCGALDAGWTVEESAELFTHVAVNIFTNYFNHYAHTELDIPAAPGL